jgi:hypothetical protein
MLPIVMIMKERGRGKLTLREDGLGINDVVQKQRSNAQGRLEITKRVMRHTTIDVARSLS